MNSSGFFKKVVLVLILVFIGYNILCNFRIIEYTVDTENLDNIGAPMQHTAVGSSVVNSSGVDVNITHVAEYEIAGRVVATRNYAEYDIKNSLSPVDVGLSWGKLASDENHKKISYSLSNRFLKWFSTDAQFVSNMGGKSGITKMNSNNHLIPSNSETRKLIKSIRVGDYIRIKGYLVNVYYETNNTKFSWISSKKRSDSGNGACEIIYVTNVKWFKK